MQIRRKALRPFGRFLTMVVLSVATLSACSSSDDDAGDDGTDNAVASETDTGTPVDDGTDGTGVEGDGTDADNDSDSELSDGSDTDGGELVSYAFVSGATPTFDAGQIERLTLGETIASSGTYPATFSDIVVRTDDTDVYQVGRFSIDSITRFTTDELSTPVYQYSVLQGETSPNTQDIVFASETKAYVIQSGGTEVLIVNPSATIEEEFITGSLDISAYDTDAPDAVSGIVANGKLFVLMQRLTEFNPVNPGYVAVFDIETDTEIATGMNTDGLNGIALSTLNPSVLQYVPSSNEVLVTGRGNIFVEFNELPGDPYSGGVETIDADNYAIELLLDDGTEDDNAGFFSASIQVTESRGYVITSTGFQNNTLRSYNVMTGLLEDGVVSELEAMDLTGLAVGPTGNVWVGVGGTEPGFVLVNPEDNSIVGEKISTQFVPNHVVFVEGIR